MKRSRWLAWAGGLSACASLSLALWSAPELDGRPEAMPSGPGRDGRPPAGELSGRSELYRKRLVPRVEVLNDLLAERLTLAQAAARFRELSRGGPPFRWGEFRRRYPGRSDEERFYRQVMDAARWGWTWEGPPRRRRALARLEAEFQDYLAGCGRPGDEPGPGRVRPRS